MFLSSCNGYEKSNVSKHQASQKKISTTPILAEKIGIPAQFMRKFKTDVNDIETIGNKIGNVVRTITQDSQGNFWFSVKAEGVYKYDG